MSQIFFISFLYVVVWVDESPTREGPSQMRERGALLSGNDKKNGDNCDTSLDGIRYEEKFAASNLAPEEENTLSTPESLAMSPHDDQWYMMMDMFPN